MVDCTITGFNLENQWVPHPQYLSRHDPDAITSPLQIRFRLGMTAEHRLSCGAQQPCPLAHGCSGSFEPHPFPRYLLSVQTTTAIFPDGITAAALIDIWAYHIRRTPKRKPPKKRKKKKEKANQLFRRLARHGRVSLRAHRFVNAFVRCQMSYHLQGKIIKSNT